MVVSLIESVTVSIELDIVLYLVINALIWDWESAVVESTAVVWMSVVCLGDGVDCVVAGILIDDIGISVVGIVVINVAVDVVKVVWADGFEVTFVEDEITVEYPAIIYL